MGGTGFIGYHLAKKSLKKGWEVTSISTNKPKKIDNLSLKTIEQKSKISRKFALNNLTAKKIGMQYKKIFKKIYKKKIYICS